MSRLSHDFPPIQRYTRPQSQYTTAYSPNEEADESFDVRADFDGTGPKWSERNSTYGGLGSPGLGSPGMGGGSVRGSVMGGPRGSMMGGPRGARGSVISVGALGMGDENYRPVDDHVPPMAHSYSQNKSTASGEELVSVPVLGPEWKKGELHDMSRRGQAEIRGESRTRAWREWTRDQRGLCGIKWMTRKVLVCILFGVVVGLALTLYFLLPRVPRFEFYGDQPFTVNNETISFNRSPTNFSFSGNLNLYSDASSSYLPVHFKHLQATLYDQTTNKKIATGDWGDHSIPHKSQQPVILPVTFEYSAVNTSDTTWNNFYSACGHIWTGTVRPNLKFRLVLKMSIVGLTKKPEMSTQIGDITCPFELPANSV
ncbi:hypothetical protein IAT38_004043 [Cryptococcus sp. DSM 104549]